jgi:hypothetical protein
MVDRGWHPVQVWFSHGEYRALKRHCKAKGRTMAGRLREHNLLLLEQLYFEKPLSIGPRKGKGCCA